MLNTITQRAVFERYLTEAEEKKLMQHVRQFADVLARRDAQWIELMRQTGIRVGSMAGVTLGDAQAALRSKRLHLVDEHAKGGRGYEVPLNTRAIACIKALVKIRADMGYGAHPDQPLVMSRNHRGMSVRSYQARMAMWVAEAGLQVSASPHWLRHTLAKRVMARSEAKDPQGIVQVVLGQRSRESTAIYTLPDREDIADALELAR